MSSSRLSFSYPKTMKDKLKKWAIEDSRSLSSYVQKILAAHIKEKENPGSPKRRRK